MRAMSASRDFRAQKGHAGDGSKLLSCTVGADVVLPCVGKLIHG